MTYSEVSQIQSVPDAIKYPVNNQTKTDLSMRVKVHTPGPSLVLKDHQNSSPSRDQPECDHQVINGNDVGVRCLIELHVVRLH